MAGSALVDAGVLVALLSRRNAHHYADVPMSLADACRVRKSETLRDPLLLTAGADFRIYRRHGRQAIPTVLPE
jgi:predicted nucleic acid-binding protein